MEISNSAKNCFSDCTYAYYLNYIRLLSPKKTPEPLFWGGLVHEVLAAYDRGGLKAAELHIAELRISFENNSDAFLSMDLEQLDRMLEVLLGVAQGYALVYEKDEEKYLTYEVEQQFKIPLANGHFLVGKLDKLVKRIEDDVIMLWERKTAARTGDAYYKALPLDNQLKTYILAVQKTHKKKITKVVYDVIKKPQIRPRKTETAEAFAIRLGAAYLLDREKLYERRIIWLKQKSVDDYEEELNKFAMTLDLYEKHNLYIPHHPKNRIGHCSYFPICMNGDESGFFVRKNLNPELMSIDADPELEIPK